MREYIKFIHSSDFHLDDPIRGLQQLPGQLLEALAEAPYRAAESVFDAAITEKVDFVILAGGLCNLEQISARAVAFLLEQFQRLEQKDILVYWCGAKIDSADRWPDAVKLPGNVFQFQSCSVEHVDCQIEDAPLVRVIGAGCNSSKGAGDLMACVADEGFNIIVAHADANVTTFDSDAIDYWGLGGRLSEFTEEYGNSVVVYPGTPQSREFHSESPHGFKLVELTQTRKTNVRTIRTDCVHWCSPFIELQCQVDLESVKNQLGEVALQLAAEHSEQTILCRWQIKMSGEELEEGANELGGGIEWRAAILDWLRNEFGMAGNGLWSICLEEQPSDDLPSKWQEEETLLGDYLRAVERYQGDSELRLNLGDYLKDNVPRWETDGLATVNEQQRTEILSKVSKLGVDCLRGHDSSAV